MDIKIIVVLLCSVAICFSSQESCGRGERGCQEQQTEPVEIDEQDFYRALDIGDLAIVQVYIHMYPEAVNWSNRVGDYPLHRAVDAGRESVVRYLLRIGADIEVQNQWQETPLHSAAHCGYYAIVRALIEHQETEIGSSCPLVHKKTRWGRTALFLAVDKGYAAIVKYLLRHGARLCGDSEHTPLGWALYRGHYDVVRVLIRYGDELESVPSHLKVNAQRTDRSFPWLSERRAYEADVANIFAPEDICGSFSVPKDLTNLIVAFIRQSSDQQESTHV